MKEDNKQHSYRRLLVWQKADELALRIYVATKLFPKDEMFSLTSQMRRAALSVPANIAEGYARFYAKEKSQFYNIARGSLTELEYYVDFSFRLGYLTKEKYNDLYRCEKKPVGFSADWCVL